MKQPTQKASDRSLKVILAVLPAVAIGLVAPAANGCGFHSPVEVHLESMHPGSFPVAVAVRRAADNGVIDSTALEALSTGTALYSDTIRRLQKFRAILAMSPTAAELPEKFSLGFVESRLWTRYLRSGGSVQVEIHTDGPVGGEAVVLTGEPVLTEMLAGRLSVDRALADGMILFDGREGEKTAIRHALQAASAANKFSSR